RKEDDAPGCPSVVKQAASNHNGRTTRRIIFLAAPGTEILDLVGPLQVFARAADKFRSENPDSPPIYSVEVISASSHRSLTASCGLAITADKTFRQLRGQIDTLVIAGGTAVEQDELGPEVVRWLKKVTERVRR